jgi:hypothetical protein
VRKLGFFARNEGHVRDKAVRVPGVVADDGSALSVKGDREYAARFASYRSS